MKETLQSNENKAIKPITQKLKDLFRKTQSLESSKELSDAEIAAEISDYRSLQLRAN